MMNKIFRIDDIGASTKQFEQYGRWKIGNFWFLKTIWPFKKWGPYKELSALEWEKILKIFEQKNIKPIVAITATWVEKDNSLTPFPQKFPEEAAILKKDFLKKWEKWGQRNAEKWGQPPFIYDVMMWGVGGVKIWIKY